MAQEDDQKADGPDADETSADGSEVSKKGMSFILKIVVILLIASISAVGGLVVTAGLDGVKNLVAGSSEKTETKQEEDHPEEAAPSYGIMNLDEMIVNITGFTATGRTTTRFLKIKLSIVYDEALGEPLLARELFLRDAFQDYLRQVNERDLAGSIGLATLKSELLKRAKSIAGNQAPESVLIGDLIIQ